MPRKWCCTIGLFIAVAGCSQGEHEWPVKKAPPAAEMSQLEWLVGTWSSEAQLVEPTPEELRRYLGEKAKDIPTSFPGSMTYSWTLDGHYLKGEGWHSMGAGDERGNMLELVTWVPSAKKFRYWLYSDTGDHGEAWMWTNDGGKSFEISGKGTDKQGRSTRGRGTMRFIDQNTMEWDWTERTGLEKFRIKGTFRKQ